MSILLVIYPVLPESRATALEPSRAEQGISVCTPGQTQGQNFIFQSCSDPASVENDAVQLYLAEHMLPSTDASVIYTYGRSDLRSEIRALMLTDLLAMAQAPSASLTSAQQTALSWFQNAVWTNEKALAQAADTDYHNWLNNPCTWTPNAAVAQAYGLTYNDVPFCTSSGDYSEVFNTAPTVPSISYFQAAALLNSYGLPLANDPNGAAVLAATGLSLGAAAGIAASAAVITAAAVGLGVGTSIAIIFPFFGTAAIGGISGTATVSIGCSFAEAAVGAAGLVAGAVAIVLIAIYIAVQAGIDSFDENTTLQALSGLDTANTSAQASAPSLSNFVTDSTGIGSYKLTATLTAATLPEFASTATLPKHGSGDPVFEINVNGTTTESTTLSYTDWAGTQWTASTWHGWLVQTGTTSNNSSVDSITTTIHYVDPSGNQMFASRFGSNFTLVKESPASTDVLCPADGISGLSLQTTGCSAWVASSFQVQLTNGSTATVSLSQPPVFTSPSVVSFQAGFVTQQTFGITATGAALPTISLLSSNFPSQLTFTTATGGVSGGQATIIDAGGSNVAPPGVYTATLQASNAAGTAQQTLTVYVTTPPSFTSGASATFTAGVPNSFLITTSGTPPPSFTTNSFLNGPTLTDNGNGTATISWTPTIPTGAPGVTVSSQILQCLSACIFASNDGGATKISEGFSITVNPQPPVSAITPTAATFYPGVPGSATLVAISPAPTAVNWGTLPGNGGSTVSLPSWATLTSTGTRTATITGTPPKSCNPLNPVTITAAPTDGSTTFTQVVNITCLVNEPTFTSPNYLVTSVNGVTNFPITTSLNGPVTEGGALPKGGSFSDNGTGTTTLQISPQPGSSGGNFPLVFTARGPGGAGSPVPQNFTLYVLAAPQITTAPSVNFTVGRANSFTVKTTGYPKFPITTGVATAQENRGMAMNATGLPSSGRVTAVSTNAQGQNTGTMILSGTPTMADVGVYSVTITANNGFGVFTQNFTLRVVIPGDVNGDGTVSCTDIGIVKAALGTFVGQAAYDNRADVNGVGAVDIRDLAFVAGHLPGGTKCP